MQTYILFEKVRGAWVKLGEYDDPTTLARMAYHLGCLHGTKPTEIKAETLEEDAASALHFDQNDGEGGQDHFADAGKMVERALEEVEKVRSVQSGKQRILF